MEQISILGCGWLGEPLAVALIADGYSVKGSTTSPEKLAVLQKSGIVPFQVSLSETSVDGDSTAFLQGSKTLIINIPPKLRKENAENFTEKINLFIPFIEKSGIEHVLFISSTSVYADDNTTISESTTPSPDTDSGKQLLETEMLLQNSTAFKTTVVRFAGLTGPNRHPVHYLAGRENIANPEAPVNLIHRNDCIAIIRAVLSKNCWGEIFNAAYPQHPSREKYYAEKAATLGLSAPVFTRDKESTGKTIHSGKIETILGYDFKNPI